MAEGDSGETPAAPSERPSAWAHSPQYIVETLSDRHASHTFRSGAAYLDWYLDTQARRLGQADVSKTFVLVMDDASGPDSPSSVAGYFTVEAGVMPTAFLALPESDRSTLTALIGPEGDLSAHGRDPMAVALKALPIVYLACLARDQRYRGTGIGGALLIAALRKAAEAAEYIGAAGVFLVATEEGAKLYAKYGFVSFQDYPRKMFLPMAEIRDICSMLLAEAPERER